MRSGSVFLIALLAATLPGAAAGEGNEQRARDRALAYGFLIDSPRPPDVIDESIRIADALRVHYGIEGGEPVTDRQAAAARAAGELERLKFSRRDIEREARRMGFSLDPERCENYCRNVEQLAILELQKRAIRRLAAKTRR